MAATLEFTNSTAHRGLLVVLKIPNPSTLSGGNVGENFPLPKPFQHIYGTFCNTGRNIVFKTTEIRPAKLLYSLIARGKTSNSYLAVATHLSSRDQAFAHYLAHADGAQTLQQRYANWLQEDGSLIFELEIIPRSVEVTKEVVKTRTTRDDLFASLFGNEKFVDFTLVCEGKSIKVAKAIISAQSEYFRAMFESDMDESKTGEVEIKTMTFDTLHLLIKFLYSGKLEGHINRDVIVAAEYLNIVNFKDHYEEFASENMHVETINEVLYIAEKFKMPNLEKSCFAFLDANNAWATAYKNMMTKGESPDAKRQRVEPKE